MQPEQRVNQLRQISQLRKQFENLLTQSHPFSPLTVAINGDVKVIKGKPLSEAEQTWWSYVRERGKKGPWQFIAAGENQRFLDVQEYFLARYESSLAASKDKRTKGEERFERIRKRLGRMDEKDYAPLLLHIPRGYRLPCLLSPSEIISMPSF